MNRRAGDRHRLSVYLGNGKGEHGDEKEYVEKMQVYIVSGSSFLPVGGMQQF